MFGNKARRIAELEIELGMMRMQTHAATAAYKALEKQWNALVDRINAKGGEHFLQYGVLRATPQASPFSDADLRRLLQLCHPDKHGNSELAQTMTTKLLSMRTVKS